MPKYLLALFLALTGLMMVIAPVAVMAMSGTMLCDRQASLTIEHTAHQPATAGMDHAHHGTDHGVKQATEASEEATSDAAPLCCDNACVAELTVMPETLGSGWIASGAPLNLSSSDLTELTHPNGLRRPPKV